jgi:fumarate hydratase class I
MKKVILEAVEEATKNGKLRSNSVDSLTGENSGTNLGPGTPVFHFEQWEKDYVEVKLILKGGGSENKSIQYSLPAELPNLGRAGRDLDGIRKCILEAVVQAQGQGCASGFIGVGIGSDRTNGYLMGKEQLFRSLDDTNPNPVLAEMEEYILEKSKDLNIGPMGFGGVSTLLGCKIGVQNRLPASFFVSVVYQCWAYRRLGIELDAESGRINKWQYRDLEKDVKLAGEKAGISVGDAKVLEAPISEEQIRDLKVGDIVLIDGNMYTGRDAFHHHVSHNEEDLPELSGGVIYHCGPVMVGDDENGWEVKAAGPTTSIREEPYQADVMKKYNLRAVIGKGGMGPKTLAGLKEHGGVYLNAIGGAAQYYAESIKKVHGRKFPEMGTPECMWHFTVDKFPAIVTMDSHGNSLHKEILEDSSENVKKFEETPSFCQG